MEFYVKRGGEKSIENEVKRTEWAGRQDWSGVNRINFIKDLSDNEFDTSENKTKQNSNRTREKKANKIDKKISFQRCSKQYHSLFETKYLLSLNFISSFLEFSYPNGCRSLLVWKFICVLHTFMSRSIFACVCLWLYIWLWIIGWFCFFSFFRSLSVCVSHFTI